MDDRHARLWALYAGRKGLNNMSMLRCVLSVTLAEPIETGRFEDGCPFSINRLVLKLSDGGRLTRYAVCVNNCWKSSKDEEFTLREARQKVEELRKLHKRFRRFTAEELREYAKQHGNTAAHDLLLLGGYNCFAGSCRDFDELLKEFERGSSNAVRQEGV